MKAHIGADTQSGLVHTVTGTAANVADIAQTHELLHGEEKEVHPISLYLALCREKSLSMKKDSSR